MPRGPAIPGSLGDVRPPNADARPPAPPTNPAALPSHNMPVIPEASGPSERSGAGIADGGSGEQAGIAAALQLG
eukprot:4915273-Alexandrium_andersonii.AAC.1